MWHAVGVKLGKPWTCYVAEYNLASSVGVIFFGTDSLLEGTRNWFVPMHEGLMVFGHVCMRIVPVNAF
jgi:hypothetical protein